MNTVDAYWEIRNLGVKTLEIEIDADDRTEEIGQELKNLNAEYQVVKAPVANIDLHKVLSENGFIFAEASIKVSHPLNEIVCSKLIKRVSDNLTFNEMDDGEMDVMENQIKGGIFQTDRVILDSFFPPSQAANRYIMWMRDEKERGSVLYSYKYKGELVGFGCMKETSPGYFYPVLGGVYNIGKALPLGEVIIYKQLEVAKNRGGKVLFTYISSNNLAVVKAYSQIGYTTEDIRYVFIKHNT